MTESVKKDHESLMTKAADIVELMSDDLGITDMGSSSFAILNARALVFNALVIEKALDGVGGACATH